MNHPWYQWFSYITGIYIAVLDIVLFLKLWKQAYPEAFSKKQFRRLAFRTRCLSVGTFVLLVITTAVLVVWDDAPDRKSVV